MWRPHCDRRLQLWIPLLNCPEFLLSKKSKRSHYEATWLKEKLVASEYVPSGQIGFALGEWAIWQPKSLLACHVIIMQARLLSVSLSPKRFALNAVNSLFGFVEAVQFVGPGHKRIVCVCRTTNTSSTKWASIWTSFIHKISGHPDLGYLKKIDRSTIASTLPETLDSFNFWAAKLVLTEWVKITG